MLIPEVKLERCFLFGFVEKKLIHNFEKNKQTAKETTKE
jgi:hypothetical protein